MQYLHDIFEPLYQSAFFSLFAFLFLINPISLFFQLQRAIGHDASAISIRMFTMFIISQAAACIVAIKILSWPMFIAYLLSIFISLAIIFISIKDRRHGRFAEG